MNIASSTWKIENIKASFFMITKYLVQAFENIFLSSFLIRTHTHVVMCLVTNKGCVDRNL